MTATNKIAAIVSPSINDHRTLIADWLELQALTSARKGISDADLIGLIGTADDSAQALNSGDLDERAEAIVDVVFDELDFRQNTLGRDYPFSLPQGRQLRRQNTVFTESQYVYLFCLLVSHYRWKILVPQSAFEGNTSEIPDLFQLSSSIAAAGFLGGCSVSFGFPRPDGSGFLDALRQTYARFGEGMTHTQALPGVTSDTKDGGVDIVAWRDWADELPGKLYLLGQCASGKDWATKSVRNYVKNFHGDWFAVPPASPIISAMFIPFPADHKLAEHKNRSYQEQRTGFFLSQTRNLGIIVDRLRIPALVSTALSLNRNIDRVDELPLVGSWVDTVLDRIHA